MNNIISIPFNKRILYFQYQDVYRSGKNIDLQTIQEIFTENVYRVNDGQLSGSKVVIDAGANLGSFSIMAAALGATKVYAIEPNVNNYEILKQNILLNNFENVIIPVNMALWDRSETLKLIDFDRDSRIDSLVDLESTASKDVTTKPEGELLQVKAIELSSFLSKNEIAEVDILKMDIEWSEYNVLPMLSEETMKKIKYLTVETHGVNEMHYGAMICNLTKQFSINTLGSYQRGGFIYANRY